MNLKLGKYKACICEGSAQQAIIDILLDKHLLIFGRDDMLDEQVIRTNIENSKRRIYTFKFIKIIAF